jgi:hypothetical protein
MNLHLATCAVWVSEEPADCDCATAQRPPWEIREEPWELFPWAVYRWTGGYQVGTYERLMSCSSQAGALELVKGMIWLGRVGLRSSSV